MDDATVIRVSEDTVAEKLFRVPSQPSPRDSMTGRDTIRKIKKQFSVSAEEKRKDKASSFATFQIVDEDNHGVCSWVKFLKIQNLEKVRILLCYEQLFCKILMY